MAIPNNGNSSSAAGSIASTSCLCNAGYTGPNGGSCEACEANTYKPTTGSAVCTACPVGSNSPIAMRVLPQPSACATLDMRDRTVARCTCTACARHTSKNNIGTAACTACTGNLASPLDETSCCYYPRPPLEQLYNRYCSNKHTLANPWSLDFGIMDFTITWTSGGP